MKYAFFDLDGTLIPVDSSILWAETLLSHVRHDREELKKQRLQFDEDYKNGCLNIDEFEDFEMHLLARFPRKELDRLRSHYVKELIAPHVLPIAVDLVKQYRRTGARVVMVTASYRYAVEPIAELFDMDDLICAEPEEKPNGEFTGRCLSNNFAGQKIVNAERFIEKTGGNQDSWKESVFFSDSRNDLPLLEHVADLGGKAVATNPDDELKKTALKKNWEILELFKGHGLF